MLRLYALGQPATQLSEERLKVKLATELSKQTAKTFYILDEPTTGLHFADIENYCSIKTFGSKEILFVLLNIIWM